MACDPNVGDLREVGPECYQSDLQRQANERPSSGASLLQKMTLVMTVHTNVKRSTKMSPLHPKPADLKKIMFVEWIRCCNLKPDPHVRRRAVVTCCVSDP